MTDSGSSGHSQHEKPPDSGQKPGGSSSDRAKPTDNGEKLDVAFRVTAPQLVAMAMMSIMALAGGLVFSAWKFNLGIGARDVGGAVMAPGMIMTRDMPAAAMRDMAAVDPDDLTYRAPVDARGDQPMEPVMDGEVKVYELEAAAIEWNILEYERVMAYAFNRQVPGPRIRLTEGDRVRIRVTNSLPEPTTVHWHGLIVPNAMDGPAEITQDPIAPGDTFEYEFEVSQAGTFFYHSHSHVDRQQALGLYGALIIDPLDPEAAPEYDQELLVQLQEWNEREGYTYPAMPMEGALPNFFTINGKAYPATETVQANVGDRLLIRFIGTNSGFIHPMHIHGGPFTVIATDGVPIPEVARYEKDTINVGPGERYDAIWTAREPGKWLLHCHINHHTTNDNVEEAGGGGLMLIIDVSA